MVKVQSYIKNLTKSVKYASVDVMSNMAPSTAELITTNSDLFKEITYVVRERKIMMDRASQVIKRSKIYEAGNELKKSIFEDIMTGNLYNKQRKDDINAKILGLDEMNIDIDIDIDEFDENSSLSNISDGDNLIADAIEFNSESSSTMISNTIARSSEYVVESQKAMNEFNIIQNIQNFNNITSALNSINENLSTVINFNNQVTRIHAENSRRYFEETTNILRENNAILKEFIEMERNRYKSDLDNMNKTGSKNIAYDDIVTAEGVPNIKLYLENVAKNINSKLSSISGLNNTFGDDTNLLLTFATSPLEFIPKMFVSNLLGKNLKNSLEKLDKSVSGFFSALMSRFNMMSKDDDNIIFKTIGEIFGVKNILDTSIEVSSYNKGPVPWDGKARQALIEVIPSQLSKLISLQSGMSEKIYDYDKGKFIEAKSIKEEYDSLIESSIKSSTNNVRKEMEDMLNKSFAFRDLDTKKTLEKDMDNFFKYLFKSGELFDYKRKEYDDYGEMNISSEDNYNIIRDLYSSMPKHMQLQFYNDIMSGRDRLNKNFRYLEESGDSIYRYLNNDYNINEYFDNKNKFNINKISGVNSGSHLLNIKDKMNNNIFFYLRKITNTLLEGIKVFITNPKNLLSNIGDDGSGDSGYSSILNRSTKIDNRKDNEIEKLIKKSEKYERFSEREYDRSKKHNLQFMEDVVNRDDITVKGVLDTKKDLNRIIEENNKPIGFFDDLIGESLKSKFDNITDRVKNITEKPYSIVSNILDRVDLRLYEVIYGKEERDYKGMKVKGFLDMLMADLNNTFTKFNTWLDEKVLIPLSEKIDGFGGKITDGILTGLGINMTSGEIKTKISRFLFGEKDDDGDYISTGLISGFADQVKSDYSDIKRNVFGKNFTLTKVYKLIKDYTYDTTRHDIEGQYTLIFDIQTQLKKFKSTNSDEVKIVKDINRYISKINHTNLNDIILKIYDILKINGYGDNDGSILGILKDSFNIAKEYTVGDITVLDQINKFIGNENIKDMNQFKNKSDELNPNKFMKLISLLRKYLSVNNFSNKKPILKDISNELSDIYPENDEERLLKQSLIDIFKNHISKLREDNCNEIAIDMMEKLKGYIKNVNISNILSLYEKIQNVINKDKEITNLSSSNIIGIGLDNVFNNNLYSTDKKDYVEESDINTINNINSVFNTIKRKDDDTENSINSISDFINKNLDIDGSHEEGLKKVPYDNYLALLHKNERVLTEDEVKEFEKILSIIDNRKGIRTGSDVDIGTSIITKVQNMLDKFIPKSGTDSESKKSIQDILNTFSGDNINDILKNISGEISKNRVERGVGNKPTLLDNVIKEFKSMINVTKEALFGTDDEDELKDLLIKNTNVQLEEATKDIFTNIKDYAPKVGSGALLGAGLGIIPGIIGGPLMWAGIGASTALVKNSNKLQDYLFGETIDGERQGGSLVSKKTIDAIDKYAPDVKKYGITGAALGLIPFTPVGMVGGLLLGSATAFAKNNSNVQDFLFGESGIIGKDAKDKVEKFLPKAVIGTLAAGVGGKVLFGSLFGPFGLAGGVVMGSVLGLASTTDKFKEAILGKEDEKGKRSGGLVQGLRDSILDMRYFVKENMLNPLKDSIAPIRKEMVIIAKNITKKVMDTVDWVFESTFGTKLSNVLSTIFSPIGKTLSWVGRNAKTIGSELLTTPFKGITYLQESLRIKHAKSDNPEDYSYMTEEEREEILKKDKFGRFLRTMLEPAKRRKHLKDEDISENKDSSDGDNSDVVNTINTTSSKTREAINLTNTTLQDLLFNVVKLSDKILGKNKDKYQKSDEFNKDSLIDTSKSSNKTNADKVISDISKKEDTASLLTTEGEMIFKRDHKGILQPEKNDVYDRIREEIDYDNTWQERLIKIIGGKSKDGKDDNDNREGLFSNIMSTINGFIPTLTSIIPTLLLTLPVLPQVVSSLGEIINYLNNNKVGRKGDSSESEIEGGGLFEGAFEGLGQIANDSKRIGLNFLMHGKGLLPKIGRGVVSPITNVSNKFLRKGTSVAKNATVGAVSKIPGLADKTDDAMRLVSKGYSAFEKAFTLFRNPKIVKIIGAEVSEAIVKFPSKIKNIVSPEVLGKIGEKLGGFMGPVAIAFLIGDIIWGMDNADEILQMAGPVPFIVRVISGLTNAINQRFAFGLIPKKFILTTIIKLIPGTALDEKIAEGQLELKERYEEYQRNMDDEQQVSFNEYSKNYKKHDKKAGIDVKDSKWWNPFSWEWSKSSNTRTVQKYPSSQYVYGRGNSDIVSEDSNIPIFPFYSQKDSKWKDIPFTTSSDKSKQTIGDSGCGPTSAAMVISGLTGHQVTPDDAAKFAISNNLKEPDGGTFPEFFKSFSEMYGVDTKIDKLQGQYKGYQIRNIVDRLEKNIPTILMGQSENNKAKTPFGKDPHYVVATGIDKNNNIIINDPEKNKGGSVYNLTDTLNSSTLSITSTYKNKGFDPNTFGGGEEAFLMNDEESISALESNNPIEAIINIGNSMVRKLLGLPEEEITNNEFGYGEDDYTLGSNPLSNHEFIQRIIPGALRSYKVNGILPSITVAQAILETGWGKSSIGNNLFGIKAGSNWKGKVKRVLTHEYVNGVKTKQYATFRDYDSIEDSIVDHGKLLTGARYNKVRSATNYKVAARELYLAGYATDPGYPNKLITVIEKNGLQTLDSGGLLTTQSTPLGAPYKSKINKGNVTGQTNIHGWLLDRLKLMSSDHGNKEIRITSGYRTLAKQQQLWDDHKKKYPNMSDAQRNKWVANPKNKPGSKHLMGLAADISTPWVKSMSKEKLASYGLWRPLSNEPWHFEATETGYPNSRVAVTQSLLSKYGTPDNPKHSPNVKVTNPKISFWGKGKGNDKSKDFNNRLINDSYRYNIEHKSDLEYNEYLYGKGKESKPSTATARLSKRSILNKNNQSLIDDNIPKYNESTKNISNRSGLNILSQLIELLIQIVNNTNNLSDIVKILSEGLNINIPEEKLKKISSADGTSIRNLLATTVASNNRTEDSDLINLIHSLETIATE